MEYTSVDGVARKINALYVGINGVARFITWDKFVGVDGVARKLASSFVGKEQQQKTMARIWVGADGSAPALKAVNTSSGTVEGIGWQTSGHELVITLAEPCNPESIIFTTPGIVNTGQATSVTYSIYGSNSTFSSDLSYMSWTTLVSNATWTQANTGNETKVLPIPNTGTCYKHIRMTTTWFYGANNYYGVHYSNLQLEGSEPTYQTVDTALEPYNQAMVLAGQGTVSSLNEVLTNHGYCYHISENATATKIMKDNYSSEITAAIDSNYTGGLNRLAHNCKCKFYVIRDGAAVTGFASTTNGLYKSANLNGQMVVTENRPVDTTGYSGGIASVSVYSNWSHATARVGLSKNRSINTTSGYNYYYKDLCYAQATCPKPATTISNLTFDISDFTYAYPILGFTAGKVNGHTGQVYGSIVNLAIVP